MLTKEDIEFLKELQNEMKTQDTCHQAAPRFWGIGETVERPTADGCGDEVKIVDSTGDCMSYSLDEYVEIIDMCIAEEDWDDETIAGWEGVDKTDMEAVVEFASERLDREVRTVETEKCFCISEQTGCFLTKRAAEKHIELNGYHYQNPVPYAMTAWRNPEFERFLKIFEEMDIDKLKE